VTRLRLAVFLGLASCAASGAPWSTARNDELRATLEGPLLQLPALRFATKLPQSWWTAEGGPQIALTAAECRALSTPEAHHNPVVAAIDQVLPPPLCVAHAALMPWDLPTPPRVLRVYVERRADPAAIERYFLATFPRALASSATDAATRIEVHQSPHFLRLATTYREADMISDDRVELSLRALTGGGTLIVLGLSNKTDPEFGPQH
jgi:hypothetical protein